MPDSGVSDAQIAAMSAAERRELITRLERPIGELLPESALVRLRRVRLVLMVGAIVGLIPWTVYLAITLPDKYIAQNWPATWVGFDVLLLLFMAVTAVLGLLRRQLLVLTAFTTGVLLICDAWFDVMTAAPADRWPSVLTAVLGLDHRRAAHPSVDCDTAVCARSRDAAVANPVVALAVVEFLAC
jgi:hypothetical protein